MNLLSYDFESALEQGFKSLFSAAGVVLHVADDFEAGELPDEAVLLSMDTGGPNSDEHLNAEGVYDNYTGSLDIEIRTARVTRGVGPTNPSFKNRQNELVATVRKILEEIDATALSTYWPGALAPTKIKPSGTERDSDSEYRTTVLSYQMQFRIT